jgi:hypothetical protein
MPRRTLPSVAADFSDVVAFFQARGIVTGIPTAALMASAKKLHRVTYSLVLWRFRLRNLRPHGHVFIEEIASDALQILPQALMGYGKTTKLLTRGVIENTVRHLYFSDHPVEFARMNKEPKYYLTFEELFQYLVGHPVLGDIEPRFDAIARLKNLYSNLSAGVHGRRVQDLEMRVALDKLTFNQTAFEGEVELVEQVAQSANFLLAAYHIDRVRSFATEDRQIILHTMERRARQVWNGLP